MNLLRLFHTVRFLKPVQVYGRLWFILHRPKVDLRKAPPPRQGSKQWVTPVYKRRSMVDFGTFEFLHEVHTLTSPSDWNNHDWARLWLYHLHYFDDLQAFDNTNRINWHRDLIEKWIVENPPGVGVGWDPYPLSRRIVNWIKWQYQFGELSTTSIDSLAIQSRFLSQRIEYHLLGNHLLANLKALFFADCFFSSDWRISGDTINYGLAFYKELISQIDENGAHYEMSPMYHALVLEDVLDVINIAKKYQRKEVYELLLEPAKKMLVWLGAMTHPDGQIALFNDSAFDEFLTFDSVKAYLDRLGVPFELKSEQLRWFCPSKGISGYVRWQNNSAVAILDCAPMGPDFLPAHGHADYLTFEFSIGKQRVFVDSGVSHYEENDERLMQRSTSVHNTLVVDHRNSAEVWGSFRVGRRAKIGIMCKRQSDMAIVKGWHTGYRNLGVFVVQREWRLSAGSIFIVDEVMPKSHDNRVHEIEISFHLHPDLRAEIINRQGVDIFMDGECICSLKCHHPAASICLTEYSFHPEFGLSIPGQKIVFLWHGRLPIKFMTEILWRG